MAFTLLHQNNGQGVVAPPGVLGRRMQCLFPYQTFIVFVVTLITFIRQCIAHRLIVSGETRQITEGTCTFKFLNHQVEIRELGRGGGGGE